MTQKFDLNRLLKWRCIGPYRGGRVVAVSGDPSDPATFYFGACAGGVWKSTDAGTYWECVSDGYFNTAAVGAIAVAEADPNVIYAGMGETAIRIDVSHGDGVYKSIDAGKSWQHMGLADTRFIGKIQVHPQNADLVFVAALGHAFGSNKERGVYRSNDGGKTWEQVLFVSEKAGAVDLTIDRRNPRVLYAAVWEAYRNFWQISSGGPESSIYRSMDGGDTWSEIRHHKGLPKGILGKIGVAASPAKSGRVWALIEAKEGQGLYRSDDYGETWKQVSDKEELLERAWYYTHITACTQDEDSVYVNNLSLWKSVDGGQNFNEITTPHGDNHDLWVDPHNSRRMVQGNDGGANVSFNGGESWTTIFNQPTAQFYHVATDNQYPYHVYGTQQDNSSIAVPNKGTQRAIPWSDCYMAGSGESGYIAVHPEDHNIVYVGAIGSSPGGGDALQRYDHRTKQIRLISIWPEANRGLGAAAAKYRFAWTYPIVISPHDPGVLFAAGNHVFRTSDEGQTWQIISPDLTLADPETLKPSGGPINLDALGAETYATIFAFVESSHEAGVFWAGSDDGLLHLSRDGGETWGNVTPPDLPGRTMISMIEQSPHDPATVYVAGTRYKLDDYEPYLYRTRDYGVSWQRINDGIRHDAFTRAIREDPGRPGLLYAGTETGLFISFDQGESWNPFQLNLPVCPIHDLTIKDNDLIVATHGRSFWILDDLTPLHQLTDEIVSRPGYIFKPREAVRDLTPFFGGWIGGSPGKNYSAAFTSITTHYEEKTAEGFVERRFIDAGENPPDGVIITYYLAEKTAEPLKLTILDAAGAEINSFSSKVETPKQDVKGEEESDILYAPVYPGMNRFIWNMQFKDGVKLKGKDPAANKPMGPRVPPGTYQVRLEIGDITVTQTFDILKDPRVSATATDFQDQYDLLMQIREKMSEANTAVNTLRDLRKQIDEWLKKVKGQEGAEAIVKAGEQLKATLVEVEQPLIVPGLKTRSQVVAHGARLIQKLNELAPIIYSADYKPTQAAYDVYAKLAADVDVQLARLQEVVESEVADFNELVSQAGISALVA